MFLSSVVLPNLTAKWWPPLIGRHWLRFGVNCFHMLLDGDYSLTAHNTVFITNHRRFGVPWPGSSETSVTTSSQGIILNESLIFKIGFILHFAAVFGVLLSKLLVRCVYVARVFAAPCMWRKGRQACRKSWCHAVIRFWSVLPSVLSVFTSWFMQFFLEPNTDKEGKR